MHCCTSLQQKKKKRNQNPIHSFQSETLPEPTVLFLEEEHVAGSLHASISEKHRLVDFTGRSGRGILKGNLLRQLPDLQAFMQTFSDTSSTDFNLQSDYLRPSRARTIHKKFDSFLAHDLGVKSDIHYTNTVNCTSKSRSQHNQSVLPGAMVDPHAWRHPRSGWRGSEH